MSFLWVGGRRVYFGWNLKHEVLCGCLNTLWHVVWEEGWARGGAELCGCRKQSSPAAGNSFGDSPPGKYLAAEKPVPACYVLVQWVKTESRPSVGSILPFCMGAGRLGRRCREIFRALQPTHSKASWDCDQTSRCWRGGSWTLSLAREGSFMFLLILLACSDRDWGSCALLRPGPGPRKAAACSALRASKPSCTAERWRQALGTSAWPPQLYPPHCSGRWEWV